MRVYKLIIIYISFLFLGCNQNSFKKPKEDNSFAITFFILNIFIPSEEIRRQCSQPNAIPWANTNAPFVSGGCINTKLDSGLIIDADTNQNVSLDTIISGKRLNCLCNGKVPSNGYTWMRSKLLFDSIPQPPPALDSLFFYSPTDSRGKNEPLTNSTYKLDDNLFCIVQCNVKTSTTQYQYQFLKIRSSQ